MFKDLEAHDIDWDIAVAQVLEDAFSAVIQRRSDDDDLV